MNGRDKDGRSNIEDTRGFMGLHTCAFRYRVLEFLQRRPDIRPHFNEFALAAYRRTHVELFREPPGGENLIQRMRIDKARIEAEKREAERQKAEVIAAGKWERVAGILARYLSPTDQDVGEMIDLANELALNESDLDRLWRWLQSLYRRQRRADAYHAAGARFDAKNEDLKRLRTAAAVRPAFFDTSGEYPRLKFPPAMID